MKKKYMLNLKDISVMKCVDHVQEQQRKMKTFLQNYQQRLKLRKIRLVQKELEWLLVLDAPFRVRTGHSNFTESE